MYFWVHVKANAGDKSTGSASSPNAHAFDVEEVNEQIDIGLHCLCPQTVDETLVL